MMPTYMTVILQLILLIPVVLARATASLDERRQQTKTSFSYPRTNPLTLLHYSNPNSEEKTEETNSEEFALPPEARLPPDKILKAASEENLEIMATQFLRDDWCKAYSSRQRIEEPGCITRTITNRFCYGQCNSFFIPKQSRSYNQAFQSCAMCQPHRVAYVTVTLRCPGSNPPTKTKRIKRVKKCRCKAIDIPSS